MTSFLFGVALPEYFESSGVLQKATYSKSAINTLKLLLKNCSKLAVKTI